MKVIINNEEHWFHGATVNESNLYETKDSEANKFEDITSPDGTIVFSNNGITTSTDMDTCIGHEGLIDSNVWGIYNPSNTIEYNPSINFTNDKFPWCDMEVVDKTIVNSSYKTVCALRLLKIPKFYYKVDVLSTGINIKLSSSPLDGYTISPAHHRRYSSAFKHEDFYDEQDYIYVDILPMSTAGMLTNFATRAKSSYAMSAKIGVWNKLLSKVRGIDLTDEDDIIYRPTMWTIDDQMTLMILIMSEFGYIPDLTVSETNKFSYIALHNNLKDCNATYTKGLVYHGMQIPMIPMIQDFSIIEDGKYLFKEYTCFGEQGVAASQGVPNRMEITMDNTVNQSFTPTFNSTEILNTAIGNWDTKYVTGLLHNNKPLLIDAIANVGYVDSLTATFDRVKVSTNLTGMQRLVLLPKAI